MTTQNDDRWSANSRRDQAEPGDREPTLDVPSFVDPAPSGAGQQPQADPVADPVADAALEAARAEVADYKDKALRAVAEMENYRRRADKEREDVAKYAITNFAREMLPVADNLRRALDSQPAAEGDNASALKAFVAGIELTERELLAAFERFGVKKIEPQGQPFDHNFHQAMFEIDDSAQPAGTVVQVMQPGYLLKDRLLRPALVAVSKGGPARAPAEGAAQDAYGAAHGGATSHRVDTKA